MLHPTEAIAMAPAISSSHLDSSAPASSSAPAGFFAQRPPTRPPGLWNPLGTVPMGYPWLFPNVRLLVYPDRAGIPKLDGGCHSSLGSSGDISIPPQVSAAVTGMFHTFRTVTMRPRRTLPYCAGLPPGLYSSNTCPSNKTLG